MPAMNYAEAVAWLYSTQLHGIRLGLENVRRLTAALGVKVGGQGSPKFLHVAGTNGKGSVCAMLDSICRAAGYRTGLFISPHLVTFRERIRVDGEMIAETEVATGLSEIRKLSAGWEHSPTFFEIATALALAHFQRRSVEVAVLETGMGGRLDATNIVTPAVSVIAPIALDHQQWLGNSLAKIAMEKGGIIKPGVPVVSARQVKEADRELRRIAAGRDAPFTVVEAAATYPVRLAGSHQLWNAGIALQAIERAGISISNEAAERGLATVEWPGRFEIVEERFVLDGAHNPAAARRLVQTWREIYGGERATIVLGILKDKDVRGICEALLPIAARVIAVPVRNERTSQPDDLLSCLRELSAEAGCEAMDDLDGALDAACSRPGRVLVTGSLFLIGEALTHFGLAPESRERSAQ